MAPFEAEEEEELDILWQGIHKDWDDNANLKGFIETKRISLELDKKDQPSIDAVYPDADNKKQIPFKKPALVFWTIAEVFKEEGGRLIRTLKPIDFIELTSKEAEKILKFIREEEGLVIK